MDEEHLPAGVDDNWLLGQERWLLLSPNLRGTVAGASSSSSSVIPSMVDVPASSHTAQGDPPCTRRYDCCIRLLAQGRPGTSGTLELHQDAPR